MGYRKIKLSVYMKKLLFSTAEYYKPYTYKNLHGRYMHLPAKNKDAKRTFVLLYGQHATLERIEPVASALTEFGDVYAVDNPGFGGMEPSFLINEYPSLSFYAGHLNYFINRYVPVDRKVTPLGISFGFQIIVQALHDYPELQYKTEEVVSFVGFVQPKNFHIPLSYYVTLVFFVGNLSKSWIGSKVVAACMKEWIVLNIYRVTRPIQIKLKTLPKAEAKRYSIEQAWLWRINDVRTHGATAIDFIKKNDLTSIRLHTNAIHVGIPKDHLVDNAMVVKELNIIFKSLTSYDLQLDNHAPLDLDSREKLLDILPQGLISKLSMSVNQKAITL